MVRKTKDVAPWNHQAEFLDSFESVFRAGRSKALFVMATGLGKTVSAALAYKRFTERSGRVRMLFLAHQNELLVQARQTFANVMGDGFDSGMFNASHKDVSATVVFSTLQSMRKALFGKKRRFGQHVFQPRRFDFIIVDESHHGHAPTYRPVIDYFKPKFLLGMTATPYRGDFKDIREIFGHEIYSLDLEEALTAGLLTPVHYLIQADEIVDNERVKISSRIITVQKLNRIFFAKKRDEHIVETILQKITDVPEPRILVFTSSVKHAERFARLLPGAVAIHSGVPHRERERRLRNVKSGLVRAAVTVDQFNEGVDIPEANVLVFLRSTQSKTIFLQQLGRGLRRVPGKKRVLVLDFVANCDRLLFLDELYATLKAKSKKLGGSQGEFSVNWGEVVFEERARQIIEMLRKMKIALTDDMLLQHIRDFRERHGRPPMGREFRSAMDLPAPGVYQRRFGGTLQAILRAGIPESELTVGQRAQLHADELTDEELLEKLRWFYKKHGRPPKKSDLNYRNEMPTMPTYLLRFGGFRKALSLAGVPVRERGSSPWKKGTLLKKLRQFYRKHGRSPSPEDLVGSEEMPSVDSYYKHFGSLVAALQAARLPVDRKVLAGFKSKHASDDELLEKLRAFHRRHGRPPNVVDFRRGYGLPEPRTYIKRFGSIDSAYQMAGIPRPEKLSARRIARTADEELLALLRAYHEKTGKIPTRRLRTPPEGLPGWNVLTSRFGSIERAFELAGLPVSKKQFRRGIHFRLSDEDLLAALASFFQKHGRAPKCQSDFSDQNGLQSSTTYVRRFGGIRKAFELAGIPIQVTRYSDSDLLDSLRRFYLKHGRAPRQKEFCNANDLRVASVYRVRFGSVEDALRKAGLPTTAIERTAGLAS